MMSENIRHDREGYRVWECKIVLRGNVALPLGFDSIPRRAAIEAVEAATGEGVACFSGWDGVLTEAERRVIADFGLVHEKGAHDA